MITIIRTLRDTSFEVRVELTKEQYAHLHLVEGRRPDVSMPMDINVMREMVALAAHFERPKRTVLPVEDEVRDAMEMVGRGVFVERY